MVHCPSLSFGMSSVLSEAGSTSLLSLLYMQKLCNTQHANVFVPAYSTSQFNALSIVHRFFKCPNVFFILIFPRHKHLSKSSSSPLFDLWALYAFRSYCGRGYTESPTIYDFCFFPSINITNSYNIAFSISFL